MDVVVVGEQPEVHLRYREIRGDIPTYRATPLYRATPPYLASRDEGVLAEQRGAMVAARRWLRAWLGLGLGLRLGLGLGSGSG